MDIKFSSARPLTAEEEAEIQRMIASDPDNPEASEEQMLNAKSFHEAFPDLAARAERELARRAR